ncbi:MAG: hypothetical protein HFE68_02930, partial [Erysipelotrichaceae bacterium]|nr:hypothetical protein [Erysipelotrichaceae bacterium]
MQMKKEELFHILEIFILIISFVMVITNLFGIALRNYSDDSITNNYNLFQWFTFTNAHSYSYYELTTKGWFLSGNQMSAILFMLFPLMLYRTYDQKRNYQRLIVIMQGLAMYMLGTKTANIGCLLILILFIGLWIVFKLMKKTHKSILFFLIISIGFGALFPFSPVGYKMGYDKTDSNLINGSLLDQAVAAKIEEGSSIDYEKLVVDSKRLKKLNADTLNEEEKRFVLSYMDEFCSFFGISPYIIDHYHDIDHSSFWAHYIQDTPNNDYRVLKTMILKDIYEKNNNKVDRYLGMGYTLNYIYTEADYSYQYYSYGLLGLLVLIIPYYAILVYVFVQGLKHFRKMFTLECSIYFVAPLLGLLIAKYSGHVLERVFPLISIAFSLGILLVHTKNMVEIPNAYLNSKSKENQIKLEVPSDTTLKELWKVQIEILDEVVRICEKYNLRYYLIYGTLIGAVRHKGFIPWDDDLDIGMPRDDFEKFLKIAPNELKDHFFLQTPESDEGYWLVFAKVRKNHTLFLENSMSGVSPSVHKGIFIDIFPQDYVDTNNGLLLFFRFVLSKALIETMYVKAGVYNKNKIRYWYLYWFLKYFSLKSLYKMQRFVAMFHGSNSDKYLTDFNTSRHYLTMIFPKEYYEPSQKCSFCDKDYSIPNNYDALLKAIYGDYMELPKPEERFNHNTTKIIFDTEKESADEI